MDEVVCDFAGQRADTDIECPYCGTRCDVEWVDLGVDLVQAGPCRCPNCKASEIGSFVPDESYSLQERQTGWYEPVSPVFSTQQFEHHPGLVRRDRGCLQMLKNVIAWAIFLGSK